MQPETLRKLATRAQQLFARMIPDCPPPSIERMMQLRQQGAFALLTAIDRTAELWDNGEFATPEDAHVYLAGTTRNIALSTDRRGKAVTHR
jgi:hypothetical protein